MTERVAEETIQGTPAVGVIGSTIDLMDMIMEILEFSNFKGASINIWTIKQERARYTEFIAQHDPKVLIGEIDAPIEEASVFFKNLKSLPESRGRPFIFMSAYAIDDLGIEAPDSILDLPFDVDGLLSSVKKSYLLARRNEANIHKDTL